MADDVVKGLKRYGFKATPYLRRRILAPERDASLCVLAGMHEISEVKDYIADAARADEPAFVLVMGKSGTGRTSVCNHLLAAYRDARQIAPEKFVVPRIRISGDDDYIALTNWITALYGRLQRHPGLTPLGKVGALDLDVALNTLEGFSRETYRTKAVDWMALTAQTLAADNAGFGVCLEDVPSFPTVEAAVEVLAETTTLVVLTIFDHQIGVRDQFEDLPVTTSTLPPATDSYPVLELYDLQGQDAEDLILSRWPKQPSPFDDAKLAAAFVKPRSAGRIMVLTGRLLEDRAESPGPAWPHEELKFAAPELPGLVAKFDRWLKDT